MWRWRSLFEERGNLAEAEQQYKKGLQLSPQDLRALLGYAHLKDIQTPHQPEEAAKLYLKAVKAHPQEACVYNNLANHYFQLGMFRQRLPCWSVRSSCSPRK